MQITPKADFRIAVFQWPSFSLGTDDETQVTFHKHDTGQVDALSEGEQYAFNSN